MRSRTVVAFMAVVITTAGPVLAQDEAALRRAFEGKSVTVKVDMPATSEGVEVRPAASTPVDFRSVGNLIKADGIGVHRGDTVTVTKVVVKDHHIEFQLGGGGYGTFADVLSTPTTPYVPYESKSRKQKDLEEDLKYAYDSRDRREIKDQISRESADRARDNTVAAVVNAQAQAANQATIAAKRAQSGSRFNIRYNDGFPEGALTPQGVMRTLQAYVEFDGGGDTRDAAPAASASNTSLRKGLTVLQVERMLGPAAKASDRTEGSVTLNIREYDTETEHVNGQFVGGVLVDYQVTPRGRH